MIPTEIFSSFTFVATLTGLLGAAAMMAAAVGFARVFNLSIISAVGSAVSGDLSHAFKPGIIIHMTTGVLFGFVYTFFFVFLSPSSLGFLIPIGAATGLFHGIVVSLLLIGTIGDNSILDTIRVNAYELGFITVGCHLIYGTIAGAVTFLLGSGLFSVL
jgi:hypothetical protein